MLLLWLHKLCRTGFFQILKRRRCWINCLRWPARRLWLADCLCITLYSEHLEGDHGVSQEQAIAQLQQLADCRQPVRLRPNAIEASLLFTQSLVLRFNAEAMTQLHPWFNHLRRQSAAELGYRLDPHLSLLHSKDPFHLRQELAQRLPLPSDPLLFGRVSAVSHPLTISSPADIAACIMLHACSLSRTG